MLCIIKQWKANLYMSKKLFDSDLVAISKTKITLKPQNPTYVRMCILDFSKVVMYKFHYHYIENRYDSNSRLSLTDTDSFDMRY